MKYITTSDGTRIAYNVSGDVTGPVLLLIHGWSGSCRYFDLNADELGMQGLRVVTVDLRFHGESDKPSFGQHIARLAADVNELLQQLQLKDVYMLGTSMGCAVIWGFIELFGQSLLKGCLFVDQAPLQNLTFDWKLGSRGCYDTASLTRLQCALEQDMLAFAEGNYACCATLPITKEIQDVLTAETLKCQPVHLAQLMADHTQLDWRPLLPQILVPCLNMIGLKSGVFPPEGCAEVGRLIPCCTSVYFKEANHWLYLEEPEIFNALVTAFITLGDVSEAAAGFADRVSVHNI